MNELTDEEIAAMPSVTEEDLQAIQASQAELDAQLEVQRAVKESALAKLALLGLTEEEARAVIGL
jgi:uncharacterized protein YjaG (DUF416 family)